MPSINYPVIGGEQNLPFYVCGVGIDFCQNDIYRCEGFPNPQFVIFTHGEGELIIDNKKYCLRKNCAFFMPAHIPHQYYCTAGEWRSWWINFSGRDTDNLLSCLKFTEPEVYNSIIDDNELLDILRKIFYIIDSDKLFGNYYASVYLYEFILEFYKRAKKIPSFSNDLPKGFINAIELIDSSYSDKISMEQLCKISDLSEAHLCRLFRKHFGMRPIEYLNKKRIQKAKELLTLSYISVESAAEQVGFENPSYFGKLFRRYEGFTPSEYKKSCFHK